MNIVKKYSAQLMVAAACMGFLLPTASTWLMEQLPAILFLLMFFTLLDLNPQQLLKQFLTIDAWNYSFVHCILLSILLCGLAVLCGASANLVLAISAITATGSAFAVPAIVKSIGLCPQPTRTMAMCIASTIIMPISLYINLTIFQSEQVNLELDSYILRLVIFILGPVFLALFIQQILPQYLLEQTSVINSGIASLLVLCFPFGLISAFAISFRSTPQHAVHMMLIATSIVLFCFITALIIFRERGLKAAYAAAITSGNRNVLLTHTVAGSALGPEYLILAGALQLPIFALPWISKAMIKWAT